MPLSRNRLYPHSLDAISAGQVDVAYLSAIPRAAKGTARHGDTRVVIEIQTEDNCYPVIPFPVLSSLLEVFGIVELVLIPKVIVAMPANHVARVVPLCGLSAS